MPWYDTTQPEAHVDEDASHDHLCDLCGERLTDCVDTIHDHLCDVCGEPCAIPENGTSCSNCGKKSVYLDAECTDLSYAAPVDENHGPTAQGTVKVTASYGSTPVTEGTVAVTWTWYGGQDGIEELSVTAQGTLDENGEAVLDFSGVKYTEVAGQITLTFIPAEDSGYLPVSKEWDLDTNYLNVDAGGLPVTINGLEMGEAWFLAETPVIVKVELGSTETLTGWYNSYEEGAMPKDLTFTDGTATFTMSSDISYLYLKAELTHTCADGDNDHWCDSLICEETGPLTSYTDENSDFACDICGGGVLLTVDGEESYHCTIDDALQTLAGGQAATVKLLTDLNREEAGTQYVIDCNLTLDLNGKTITSDALYAVEVWNFEYDTSLTVVDTSESGSGTIDEKYGDCFLVDNATLTLKGGIFEAGWDTVSVGGGVLDLRAYPDPAGMTVCSQRYDDLPVLTVGEHKAAEGKHTCDYCGETVSECVDSDNDGKCDTCGASLVQPFAAEIRAGKLYLTNPPAGLKVLVAGYEGGKLVEYQLVDAAAVIGLDLQGSIVRVFLLGANWAPIAAPLSR